MFLELKELVLDLKEKLTSAEKEIKELKARLKMDSSNSSKPPSSDSLNKPIPKTTRKKSQKKQGGQHGHEGKTLHQVKNPDEVILCTLSHCPDTGVLLSKNDIFGYKKRQVFELPEPKLRVVEYSATIYKHPITGELIQAPFPDNVKAPVQYGSRFRSLLIYLSDWHFIPNDRIVQLVNDIFSYKISPATIQSSRKGCTDNLPGFFNRVDDIIRESEVAHADETGFRVNGKLWWLHVACTEFVTRYFIHKKRGADAINEMGLWQNFKGTLIHDCWSTYFSYNCKHGLCNEHLVRELLYLHEEMEQNWAKKIIDLLYEMKKSVDAHKENGTWLNKKEVLSFKRRYKIWITKGNNENPFIASLKAKRGRPKRSKAQNLLNRLTLYQDYFLAFIDNPSIPFTNNQAERDVRMMKVKLKVSGCFRTENGANKFTQIRSYLSTLRKNAQNILSGIQESILGNPFLPQLLPE